MYLFQKYFLLLILQLFIFSETVLADYSAHPKAAAVIETLVKDHSFTEKEVKQVLAQATKEQRILKSMAGAAEKTKTWKAYKSSFITNQRIDQGVKFIREHYIVFNAMEEEFGVPKEVVAAILGVETNYGSFTGKANVLNALSTLAFEHPRRGGFFSKELIEYIVLCKERGWNPTDLKGSYAGAMGLSQFMPSNYRQLSVDGNKDGVIDLLNPADAIYSTANYLAHYGYRAGELIAVRASNSQKQEESFSARKLKPDQVMGALRARGIFSERAISDSQSVKVIQFKDADSDEMWLGLNNFYVISRYNPRSKYTMAVYLLSEAIAGASLN